MFRQLTVLAALIAMDAGSALAQQGYRIVDLGTLGGRSSRAHAINEEGVVAGEAEVKSGELHAFRWTAASGMQDLGASDGRISRAFGINDRGDIVGEIELTNGATQPFRWNADAGMTVLAQPAGLLGASAHAINHFGVIAGAAESMHGSRAIRWELGEAVLLATTGAAFSAARAVNDEGLVAGQVSASDTDAFASVAFVFPPHSNAQPRRLRGPVAGGSSSALAVNREGGAAGFAEIAAGSIHAVYFEPGAETGRDLDTMNNAYSCANALNDEGAVVGVFFNGAGDHDRAFLWRNGEMFDLNELAGAEPEWLLAEARGVNGRGEIVGYGTHNGQERAFLLQPVARPRAAAVGVEFEQPTNGMRLVEPADVAMRVVATAQAGVKRVTFLANGGALETRTNAPYAWTWEGVPAGDYDLTALVTDLRGNQRKSRRVRVRVELPNHAPEAWIVEHGSGLALVAGVTNELSAAAQDPDGTIAALRLMANDAELVTSNNTEFVTFNWVAPTGGEVRVWAEALDDGGAVATSPVVRVEWK